MRAAVAERLSADRAAHSERVAEVAAALARGHGLDVGHAALAGLLHDWCREVPADEIVALARSVGLLAGLADADVIPSVLHGPVAARLLPRNWPDLPVPVLSAIDRHTTGDAQMTDLDCLIFVADFVEPGRALPDTEGLRRLAAADLWAATLAVMDAGLAHLLEARRAIDTRSVRARNAMLARVAPPRRPPTAH